jgi:porphobilinogen synthase
MVHSLQSALNHLGRRLEQGLNHFLIVAVNEKPSLELFLSEDFCVVQLLKEASDRWGRSIALFADVGLSPYQVSGHSVISTNGEIDHQASYEAISRMGLAFARAGADAVAPCLSLPEQTKVLRQVLDQEELKCDVLPYSTKFSSSLYGPYRQAIGSSLGNVRKSYQFDFSNAEQAIQQTEADIAQGAMGTIVKPALPYLDVLAETVKRATKPVAVYHVSGEFMMARLAAQAGLINEDDYYDEIHSSFSRSWASWVIGYAADQFRGQQRCS